jgi:hypothetical protein
MSCYKSITLDNLEQIKSKSLELFPAEFNNQTSLFYIDNSKEKFLAIPELKHELDKLKLTEHVYAIAFYSVNPNAEQIIHEDNGTIIYSLNIPLKGCSNTFVNFYSSTRKPEERITRAGNKFHYFDPSYCRLIDQLEMTTPHIINVKVPHCVVNNNLEPRITMLIRLNPEVGQLF